jgi:hypothetical protein
MSSADIGRFENTIPDLRGCLEHLHDEVSESEEKARKHLIDLCREIVEEADDYFE